MLGAYRSLKPSTVGDLSTHLESCNNADLPAELFINLIWTFYDQEESNPGLDQLG